MERKVGKLTVAFTLIYLLIVLGSLVGVYFLVGSTETLRVYTTTSLFDTGLLDAIEEQFEEEYPIQLQIIAKGTGQAIKFAQNGDTDMIIIHAPTKEFAFLEDGYGVCRKIIAYNFFTIVGSEEDPVNISNLSPTQALVKIVEAGRNGEAIWVSRGDDSGTHTEEKSLWVDAGFNWTILKKEVEWFRETGSGMGKTLLYSNSISGYTLADMGTYLKYYSDGLTKQVVLINEYEELLNVYSAIVVNQTLYPHTNFDGAITFLKFLISEDGQYIIDQYKEGVYEKRLFYSAVELLRKNTDPTLVSWIEDFAYFNGTECPAEYRYNHPELYN